MSYDTLLTYLRHVATDNFAQRLYEVSQRVTSRLNHGKKSDDKSRARRALIIRGYKPENELMALNSLLKDHTAGDSAAPTGNWFRGSTWKLHLSTAYWILAMLRSPAVPPLHEDDSHQLFLGQRHLDKKVKFKSLRDVAAGRISWAEYESSGMVPEMEMKDLFLGLWGRATVLCMTPDLTETMPFFKYKSRNVKGVAVDEAGNMSRPDLYSVWGNTLLPCVLAGDDAQLRSTVLSAGHSDGQGGYVNRFSNDGSLSALAFLRGTGWPVFRG